MLRRIAFGSMCLGLVALGVAITCAVQADETGVEGLPPIEATDAQVAIDLAVELQAELSDPAGRVEDVLVETTAGPEAVTIEQLTTEGDANGVAVLRNVIVQNQDGERRPATAELRRARVAPGPIADPVARETLESLIVRLKRETDELQQVGKQDEAAAKMRAIEALHLALAGGPRAGISFTNRLAPEDLAKFQERLQHAQQHGLAVARTGAMAARPLAEMQAQRQKLEARIAQLEAELHSRKPGDGPGPEGSETRQLIVTGEGDLLKVLPARPGEHQGFEFRVSGPIHDHIRARLAPHNREVDGLRQKAAAMQQAAEKLKEAGLEDQARNVAEQSEKLRQTAEKMMADAAQQAARHHIDIIHANPAGPPQDLVKMVAELREQVQELRKEVSAVRQLLEKK